MTLRIPGNSSMCERIRILEVRPASSGLRASLETDGERAVLGAQFQALAFHAHGRHGFERLEEGLFLFHDTGGPAHAPRGRDRREREGAAAFLIPRSVVVAAC